jgi:16S rRNA (guanine527-N7)-methyltransferase
VVNRSRLLSSILTNIIPKYVVLNNLESKIKMDPARIAELLAPFLAMPSANDQGLTANDALYHNISTYIDILLRWNARINLTAIRDPEEIITRHFGESLSAARLLFPSTSSMPAMSSVVRSLPRLADVGSGAGFPGIPIKLWNPLINLTLIESNHKKATFLREVARSLTLTDINIFPGRAEDLPRAQAGFDIVTLRAVEHFESVLKISAELLAPGGRLALLIGASQVDVAHTTLPFLLWNSPHPIPQSSSRTLLIGSTPRN